MFQHYIVKNFRAFASLHFEHLERVNLIAGKNNTGKTAVLESIHLHNHPNNCQLPLAINKLRGVEEPGKSPEDVLGWLFCGKDAVNGLSASSFDDKGVNRTLTMWLLDATSARERFPEAEQQLQQNFRADIVDPSLPRLVLRYEQSNEPERVSIGVLQSQWLSISSMSVRLPWNIPSIYLSSGVPSTDQDVKIFGELELTKRQAEIIPALQILDPRVERLSLIPLAGEPVIHGDIGLPRLVPVPFMGEGTRRLLSILLAIINASGGVVLIDEIENGLHYSVMKAVWQAIAHAARKADVQVFATTHSYECIQAAHRAFRESQTYDLRLFRLDRTDTGIQVATYDQSTLDTSIDMNLEVR